MGGNGGMAMIKSIMLKNFKGYKDETNIEVKPLTILCGVNSSGKSSILKSLLMMKQTVVKDSPYNKLSFMGNYVDNGYFEDILNQNTTDDYFVVENTFTLRRFSTREKKRQDMTSFKEISKLYYNTQFYNKIEKFEISHKVKVGKSSNSGMLNFIDNNNVLETVIKIKAYDIDNELIPEIEGEISIEKINPNGREYYIRYFNLPLDGKLISCNFGGHKKEERYICYFNNIKLTNIFKKDIDPTVVELKITIMTLFNLAAIQYSGIKFIAPLRQFPSRNYTITGDVDSVGFFGENAPVLYAKLYNKNGIHGMPTPYYNDNHELSFDINKINEEKYKFNDQAQLWFDYFNLGKIEMDGRNGLISVSVSNHNISDVGFGVSQTLPIIIQGMSMTRDEILLLEQPEIHLHPKMQMNMADFLLSMAVSERNVIVETHSDHIINRVVRRVMENPSLLEYIKIYFIYKDRDDNSKIYNDITIDQYKGLINCPDDFFDQYGDELKNIMSQAYKNYNKHQEEVI